MKSLITLVAVAALCTACNNESPKQPAATGPVEATAIFSHKYWVSKPFNDALFAPNVVDTLFAIPCSELVFVSKDTLLMTACLSDAGKGWCKSLSANSLEVHMEGVEEKAIATYDEKTGILHFEYGNPTNGWPSDYIAQDAVNTSNIDEITINLGRKRLAGTYTMLPPKGGAAITSLLELRADGTQTGLGDYDTYEPWPSGVGGGAIYEPARNVLYLVKKGKEGAQPAIGWRMNGDTLRLWDTKDISQDGDMPEYRVTKLRGTYVRTK